MSTCESTYKLQASLQDFLQSFPRSILKEEPCRCSLSFSLKARITTCISLSYTCISCSQASSMVRIPSTILPLVSPFQESQIFPLCQIVHHRVFVVASATYRWSWRERMREEANAQGAVTSTPSLSSTISTSTLPSDSISPTSSPSSIFSTTTTPGLVSEMASSTMASSSGSAQASGIGALSSLNVSQRGLWCQTRLLLTQFRLQTRQMSRLQLPHHLPSL